MNRLNIQTKQSGDPLQASEFNSIVNKANEIVDFIGNNNFSNFYNKDSIDNLMSDIQESIDEVDNFVQQSNSSTLDDIAALELIVNSIGSRTTSLEAVSANDHSKIEAITSYDENQTLILTESVLDKSMIKILSNNTSGSYAEIATMVESTGSGIDINSAIQTKVDQATANFVTKTYVDNADSGISNSLTTIRNAIQDPNSSLNPKALISSSTILSKSNANEAKLDAIATWNGNSPTSFKAGLVTTSNIDSAVSGLIASATNNNTKTGINNLISSGVTSGVAAVENRVTAIENNYIASSKLGAEIKDSNGNITAATIMAAVNSSSGSSAITLNANHINLQGSTIFRELIQSEWQNSNDYPSAGIKIGNREIITYAGANSSTYQQTASYSKIDPNKVSVNGINTWSELSDYGLSFFNTGDELSNYCADNFQLVAGDYMLFGSPTNIDIGDGDNNTEVNLTASGLTISNQTNRIEITANGITFNNTTKTWTQIFDVFNLHILS